MFDLSHDLDPITPSGGELLAEIGIDARHLRDALADDLVRRCPEAPANRSWMEAREG